MSKPTKRNLRPRAKAGSLLSPESMGGIVAGNGFDFQTRYAACHLPLWLQEGAFHQFFFEGTGDIDIHFNDAGHSYRCHIQVKDHEVAPGELKSVIEHFQTLDSALPGVYRRFTLVCPSLSAKLRPLESGLSRFRNAKPFYDDIPHALVTTKDELDERLRANGLDKHVEFIHAKIFIETGHGDLRHDDRAVELFIARLQSHPEYAGKLRAMVQPAFAEVMRTIGAKKGVALGRGEIEKTLRDAVASGGIAEKKVTIWVQNWTNETFEPPADHSLDWSSHFERATRRVPSSATWDIDLLPELNSLQKRITTERTERVIRFRGKCALSTGIAMGAAFPGVGGWVFEIPQPPSKVDWRSDAAATSPYDLQIEIGDGSQEGTDIVLGLNVRGDGRADIMRYIESTGIPARIVVFMSPVSQGAQSIGGAEDANAFARAVREQLGQLLKKHGLRRTHVFFYGPFALAVFLGQQLTSVGEVQLFEYQDPGYVPSCTLRT